MTNDKNSNRVSSKLELTNVSRKFGAVIALDGLNLTVEPGELVALLGPSGCGKTTALRIVAGLESADSGSLKVNGVSYLAKPANERDMGMVFQSYSLFPNMTVAENIEYGLRVRKIDSIKRGDLKPLLLKPSVKRHRRMRTLKVQLPRVCSVAPQPQSKWGRYPSEVVR